MLCVTSRPEKLHSRNITSGMEDSITSNIPYNKIDMPGKGEFRVIIVGGGPIGLMAAHCLTKTGIDYVLLERREELHLHEGTSIVLWPHNIRILDQLGLLEEAESIVCPMPLKCVLRKNGSEISRSNLLEIVSTNHGHPYMISHREKLIKMLYKKLESKEGKVLPRKHVTAVATTETGVMVTCQDKSTYSGSIVLGADGAYSTIRRLMDKGVSQSNGELKEQPEVPFLASYRALYGFGDTLLSDKFEPGVIYEIHGDKFVAQLNVIDGRVYFLLYERLVQSASQPMRFSPEDHEEFAKRYSDIRFTRSITFADIWGTKQWSWLANINERVASIWHGDRAVLVGDAAHTMTPIVGLGMNTGFQDVVELVNRLRSLLQIEPRPDTKVLSDMFGGYQKTRTKDATDTAGISGLATRIAAWNNPAWKFLDQYIVPHVNGDAMIFKFLIGPIFQNGITLDFLEEPGFKTGRLPWKNGKRKVEVA
ncbi:FAD binding domain-containing protein [Xylariaceae sp. FL0662B]|nr:FAD binding domain-containing protein [Xylariaceae sp. FL0662B]